jgi:hypothetical protein
MKPIENIITTRRALLGAAVAASSAAALPTVASAVNVAVRPEIQAAFDCVMTARRHAYAIVGVVGDLEEIKFADRAQFTPAQEVELNRAEDAVTVAWAAWGEAVEALLAIPARTIAEVELKFRAAADHEGQPETFRVTEAHQRGFGLIWRDLITLAGVTA